MKHRIRTLLFIGILIFGIPSSHAQDLMSIGEVFDYEVGDRFHYRSESPMVPPNADRVEIIGKYYSTNTDTVFYVRFHDAYATEVIWEPEPHLEYTFWTKTDTMWYVMLDSSVTYYQWWASYDTSMFSYDTLIYDSEDYCDSTINGYEYATNYFEPDVYKVEYGKGIGQVWYWYSSGSAPNPGVQTDYGLFYYQKDGIDCGIPDSITVSIQSHSNFPKNLQAYPNPFNTTTTIEYSLDANSKIQITIYNIVGEVVYNIERVETPGIHKVIWSPRHLPGGMYYAVLRSEEVVEVLKILKQ